MRHIMRALCIIAVSSSLASAENDSYKAEIDTITDKAEYVRSYVKDNTLTYAVYSKWYEGFKGVKEAFTKTFYTTDKEKGSFQLMRRGMDKLDSAWSILHQADEAEKMYRESITEATDVSYAHKWKDDAITKKRKACETVLEGLELLQSARESAKTGN